MNNIPAPPGAHSSIPAWDDLCFNPLGLYNIRQQLGMLRDQPGIFTKFEGRFLASDVTWFANGLSGDGNHHTQPDSFHPLFSTSCEHQPSSIAADPSANFIH
jgi:hypothetical protein